MVTIPELFRRRVAPGRPRRYYRAACGGLLLWIACVGSAHSADTTLVLSGSSTIAPLALEIGRRFESLHPGIRVDVQAGGSTRGINDARSGLADIGMVSRALSADEQDLTAWTIAMDGIGIIVNRANTIAALTREQIVALYTGTVRDWREVGGATLPVTVVNKAEGRSTLELFLQYFALRNSAIRAHVVIGDNQQGVKTVAGNPGAIGYVSVGTAEFEEAHGTAIRLLTMEGVPASAAAVAAGAYPLSRPLNLVTDASPRALAVEFIEFARSPQVDDLIAAQFFVPVGH